MPENSSKTKETSSHLSAERSEYNHDKIVDQTYPQDKRNRKDRMTGRKQYILRAEPCIAAYSMFFGNFLYSLITRKCFQISRPVLPHAIEMKTELAAVVYRGMTEKDQSKTRYANNQMTKGMVSIMYLRKENRIAK